MFKGTDQSPARSALLTAKWRGCEAFLPGFSERSGYTAIGTVCNLAARLCAEAKDEQILVSSRIAEAVEAVAARWRISEIWSCGVFAVWSRHSTSCRAPAQPTLDPI